ncbi:sensor histidine kinase [Cyclobacterium qasimii]|uniref:histidine kinase n=2 Tax=Cyclobacterium qasimii TaxID=1350429 RepID=S7V803_9BACT|nr:PAS domain S-box protein [Cyclobacterium qasimii]EPR66061.1 two-component system sensor histidine kinase [Cyclobacterium qasimii M12-11B]GEO21187.1 histidine kinase [Cyclobacterium qasimii]
MAAELKDNELFKGIFESSVEGILVVDHEGSIIRANPSVEKMFGYQAGELIKRQVEDLIPEKFQKNHQGHRMHYAKKPKSRSMGKGIDLWGLRKNGTQFPLEISLSPTSINEKKVVIAFIMDISTRLSALKEAAINSERMNEAQSLAHVGSYVWNLQTNERNWSDEFYKICGLPPGDEKLTVETASQFIHPEDRKDTLAAIDSAIKNQTPYSKNTRFVRPDGTVRFIMAKGKATYDTNGNPLEWFGTIQDITAEKTIENMLYIRNRALAATASGIIICDALQPDFPIIYGNDAFSKTTGYDRDYFIGKNCRFLQGQDKNQKEIKIMATALKQGKGCRVVLRNYRKDASLFWNEVAITPIYNDNKVLTHFVGVQNDVTALKVEEYFKIGQSHVMNMIIQHEPLKNITDKIVETIETAIPNCVGSILLLNKENGTLHKLTVTNLPEGFMNAIEGIAIGPLQGSCGSAAFLKKEVIVTDISNDANWKKYKELASTYNLKACWSFPLFSSNQELLGTFAIYFNTPRKPLAVEREIIFNITQATSVAIEQHNVRTALNKSREELATYAELLENRVSERTTELKDIVQKLVESNLSLEDQIQDTKAAENRALSSQELLGNISKNFPKGFVAVVNSKYELIFMGGEELDELGFRNLADSAITISEITIVPEEVKKKVATNVQKTFEGQHCSFEIYLQSRSYLVNTTPLFDKDKNIVQVLLVNNNITDQKKIEIEIRNTLQKEKELNELRSRFISMASHEFRTPLSVILSATNLIERQNEPGKEDKRLKYVGSIKSSIKNLVAILNDFLSLSKLEEGKVVAQPILFDFIDFSKSLVEEIQGIKKKGQVINLLSNQTIIEVGLDPKLTRHILHNLLSNAIKYSDENKTISYTIDCNDEKLLLTFSDQGIGIPEEEVYQLFQRFYRAKNVTNIQGTGLGLNIVKQYTELMGGNVSFESKLNVGTTFTVELPINLMKNEKNTAN